MRSVFIGRGMTKIVNLLFPLRCPVCDEIVPVGEGKACRSCRGKIRYIREPKCQKCEYAAFYAQEIYERLKNEIHCMEADAIIPIPLHVSRQKSRGYNQAELIAAHLSKLTGIPLEKNLVKRIRKTVPQKQLDARARQNNLKKAFNIKPNVVKLSKTILIDDIYTTGSTVDAVARELKCRGVGTVYFITLCIGEGF